MNPIQAAEDVLQNWSILSGPAAAKRREVLKTLLTHARTLEAELASLREPLGDYKELIDEARSNAAVHDEMGRPYSADIERRAAAFITRLSAEIAELRAALEAEQDAERMLSVADELTGRANGEGWENDPTGLSHLSEAFDRAGASQAKAREMRHAILGVPALSALAAQDGGASDE